MGIDSKYGHITTERGMIPEYEPVFVIRGRDSAAPAAIMRYASEAAAVGAAPDHVADVRNQARRMAEWQRTNPDLVRVPSLKPGQIEATTGGADT